MRIERVRVRAGTSPTRGGWRMASAEEVRSSADASPASAPSVPGANVRAASMASTYARVDRRSRRSRTGTGFAVTEGIYYLAVLHGAPALVWVVRGLGTAVMHGSATALVAMASGGEPADSSRIAACRAITSGAIELIEADVEARLSALEQQGPPGPGLRGRWRP